MLNESLELFFSYSQADENLRNSLEKHLNTLKTEKVITDWHDRKLVAVEDGENVLTEPLRTAQILLLLLSPDSLDSDYYRNVEIPTALARHESGEAFVIPVILRPCAWQDVSIAKLQAYPRNSRLISLWGADNEDAALLDVVEGITAVAKEIGGKSNQGDLQKLAENEPESRDFEGLSPPALFVSASGEAAYSSISQAIEQASPGTQIFVKPGIYRESLILDKYVEIIGNKSIDPAEEVIIESTDMPCLVMRTDVAVVRGLSLRSQIDKVEIANSQESFKEHQVLFTVDIPTGELLLEDCDITSRLGWCIVEGCNVFGHTKAQIYIGGESNPTIRKCKIYNGKDDGICILDEGQTLIKRCEMYGNDSVQIRIAKGSKATIQGCKIHSGKSSGIYILDNGQALIEKCKIYDHEKTQISIGKDSRSTIQDCKIHSGEGNGIYILDNGQALIERCKIYDHEKPQVAIDGGDRVENDSDLTSTIRNCKIYGGKSNGIYVDVKGRSLIEKCKVYGNESAQVRVENKSHAIIQKCKIYDASGKTNGIHLLDEGQARIKRCEIYGNDSVQIRIEKGSKATIQGCKIHNGKNNGIYILKNGQALIERCKIYNHESIQVAIDGSDRVEGDRVKNDSNLTATLRNCKIYEGKINGIYVDVKGLALIEKCKVYGNKSVQIDVKDSTADIRRCVVRDSISNGIRFQKNGQGSVENCEIYGHEKPQMYIKEESNITILGCKIYKGGMNNGIYFDGGQGSVENCEIYGHDYPQMYITNNSKLTIWKCRIHDGGGRGISILDASQALIKRCKVYGNKFVQIDVKDSIVDIQGCVVRDSISNGIRFQKNGQGSVENCEIYGHEKPQIAIQTINKGSTPTIRNCKIHSGKGNGIYILDGGKALIERCRIYEHDMPQVAIDGKTKSIIRNCKIYNGKSNGVYIDLGGQGIRMECCDIFKNTRAQVSIDHESSLILNRCKIHHGGSDGVQISGGESLIIGCEIFDNASSGIQLQNTDSDLTIRKCQINRNRLAIKAFNHAQGTIEHCNLTENTGNAWEIESWYRIHRVENRE
jgi:F-box protein 11